MPFSFNAEYEDVVWIEAHALRSGDQIVASARREGALLSASRGSDEIEVVQAPASFDPSVCGLCGYIVIRKRDDKNKRKLEHDEEPTPKRARSEALDAAACVVADAAPFVEDAPSPVVEDGPSPVVEDVIASFAIRACEQDLQSLYVPGKGHLVGDDVVMVIHELLKRVRLENSYTCEVRANESPGYARPLSCLCEDTNIKFSNLREMLNDVLFWHEHDLKAMMLDGNIGTAPPLFQWPDDCFVHLLPFDALVRFGKEVKPHHRWREEDGTEIRKPIPPSFVAVPELMDRVVVHGPHDKHWGMRARLIKTDERGIATVIKCNGSTHCFHVCRLAKV